MIRKEVLGKTRRADFDCARFGYGVAGRIGQAYSRDEMELFVEFGRQVVLYIAFSDVAHGGSSCSVAYLKVARLKLSLEC